MNPPLLPLAPFERLGWMRHFKSIRCRVSFPGFKAGKHYPMECETVRITSQDRRERRNGTRESVRLTGAALMILITADNGWRHRFLQNPPPNPHPIIHTFGFLVDHFEIPEVPDVTTLNPKGFETYKARLRALES